MSARKPAAASAAGNDHQVVEAVLYASVLDAHAEDLKERLVGICDPIYRGFDEHEMIFNLKLPEFNDVSCVRFRRSIHANKDIWHCRYVGASVGDRNMVAFCRSSIDSHINCREIMEFVKSLGLRFEYEYIARGFHFTRGSIKVVMYKMLTTEKFGVYSKDSQKAFQDSYIVEASVVVDAVEKAPEYCRKLRDFCDQFKPLIEFKRYDYTKPSTLGGTFRSS